MVRTPGEPLPQPNPLQCMLCYWANTLLSTHAHAMVNLAILTKSRHSIDDDEFGEISPTFPKLNVSYANYPNIGSPMLTW